MPGTVLSIYQILTHFVPTAVPFRRSDYFSHCTDLEAEPQKSVTVFSWIIQLRELGVHQLRPRLLGVSVLTPAGTAQGGGPGWLLKE